MDPNDRRGAEDTGHEDQRMVKATRSETPITDVVREAIANRGAIFCELEVFQRRADWPCGASVELFPSSVHGSVQRRDNPLSAPVPTDDGDVASALRITADALSSDTERRALEIAAELVSRAIMESDWWRGKLLWVVNFLLQPEKFKQERVLEQIDELLALSPSQMRPWIREPLQQAREFFAAEDEAAASE